MVRNVAEAGTFTNVLRFLFMWMQRVFIVTGAFLVATGIAAKAQLPPPAATAPPAQSSGQGCIPSEAKPHQGTIAPREGTVGQSSESLGDKLAQSDGVICPPSNVDPGMRATAPDVGTMPVIPPPGSPGGDQTVRPK